MASLHGLYSQLFDSCIHSCSPIDQLYGFSGFYVDHGFLMSHFYVQFVYGLCEWRLHNVKWRVGLVSREWGGGLVWRLHNVKWRVGLVSVELGLGERRTYGCVLATQC